MLPLHPALVHFPIALLTISLLAELCALVFKSSELSRAGWWMQAAGTVGLCAAVGSGLLAKEGAAAGQGAVLAALDAHQQWAFVAGTLFAVLFFWRIAERTRIPQRKMLYLVLFIVAVLALWTAAWHGGELVYRFGAGQMPLPE